MFNWYELRERWKHDQVFMKESKIAAAEHL